VDEKPHFLPVHVGHERLPRTWSCHRRPC
jgi:hypothetical protein